MRKAPLLTSRGLRGDRAVAHCECPLFKTHALSRYLLFRFDIRYAFVHDAQPLPRKAHTRYPASARATIPDRESITVGVT